MQKALTYLLVKLGDPSEPQASITQCDINSTTPLSYRLPKLDPNAVSPFKKYRRCSKGRLGSSFVFKGFSPS